MSHYRHTLVFRQIFFVPKVLGLFPFEFDGNEIRVDKLNLIYSAAVMAGYILILGYYCTTDPYTYSTLSVPNRLFVVVLLAATNSFIFISYLSNFFLRWRLTEAVKLLAAVDQTIMPGTGRGRVSMRTEICHLLMQGSFMVLKASVLGWGSKSLNESAVACLAKCLCFLLMMPLVRLTSAAADVMTEMQFAPTRHVNITALYTIARLFKLVTRVYSPQLLHFTFVAFLHIVIGLYMVVAVIIFVPEARLVHIFSYIVLALANTNLIFPVVYASEQAKLKSKDFTHKLYEVTLQGKTSRFQEDEKLWLHFSMKEDFSIKAFGFLKMDYALLQAMLGSATTYVVILLKLQQD